MKTSFLLTVFLSTFLLVSAGCENQKPEQNAPLPQFVDELEAQEVPESKKQDASEKTAEISGENSIELYRGSWFDIEYPKDFTANPTSPTNVQNGIKHIETDEARFGSPDKTVEFFIFSPIWNGDPINYLALSPTEELVSEKTDESGADLSKKIIRWVTVKAKDNTYYRSFVSIKGQVGTGSDTHHVFGIKYQNSNAYERYRDAYITFKKSLRQYAD